MQLPLDAWSPLVWGDKSLFTDEEPGGSHGGETQGPAQQAQQPRRRGQVPLPEGAGEWSGWDILGERRDVTPQGHHVNRQVAIPPTRLGRSQLFPKVVQGRRVMAVRSFCHPEQPVGGEDGVTCGWNEVLFGFKPQPGAGQN